jgi:hypothetical protein
MTLLKRLVLGVILIFILSAVAAGAWLALSTPPTPLKVVAPVPNAYETYASAATLVRGPLAGPNALPAPVAVATNQAALEKLHQGVKQEIILPAVDPMKGPATAPLRQLGTLLELEGKAFETQNAKTNAANSYLDAIRFGKSLERGVLVDVMIGLAVEKSAWARLENLARGLDAGERAAVLAAVEGINRDREPFDQILAREKAWARANATGFGQRLILATGYGLRPVYAKSRQNYEACVAQGAAVERLLRSPSAFVSP